MPGNLNPLRPGVGVHSARPLLHGARWSSLWIIFSQVTKVIRGLIVPKLLDPSSYGLWSSLSVLLGYARYADLGVNEQLAKRLPYRLGKEGEAGYRELARQGTGWGIITSGVVAVALLGWSFLYSGPHPEFYRVALRLIALAAIAQKLRFMGSTLLGSRFMFRQSAIGGMLVDGVGLVLAIGFLIRWGVLGLVWAFLATEFVVAIYYFAQIGFPIPTFVPSRTLPMVREGFVLLAVVLAEQALMTVDQLFLISFFPKEQYGIYALGLFLTTALLSASGIFLTVTQPKVMHLAGEGKLDEARKVVRTSLTLYIVMLAAVIGATVLGTDLIVSFYLTKYQTGLGVFVLMPLLALVRGPVILLRPLFLARNQEKRLVAIEVFGLALAVALDALVIALHPSLAFVASASILGYGLVVLMLALDLRAVSDNSERGSNRFILAITLASIAGTIGLFLFYSSRGSAGTDVSQYLVTGVLVCASYTAWVGLFVWAGRRHWQEAWRVFRHGSGSAVAIGPVVEPVSG